MDTPTDTPIEPQPAPSSWLTRARAALTIARDRLTTWWGRVREASPLPSWVVALFVLLLVILFVAMRAAPPAPEPAPAAEQPAAVQTNPLAELVTRLDELDAMVADLQDQVAELQDLQQPAAAPRRSAAPRPAAMGPTPAGQPPQPGAAWSTPTDLDRALTTYSKTLQESSK